MPGPRRLEREPGLMKRVDSITCLDGRGVSEGGRCWGGGRWERERGRLGERERE